MSDIRLHEGELNIMELLWSNKSIAAKDIAKIIKEYIGWEKNTTYTVISRLIDKGAIKREDPGFICKAAVTRKAIQKTEASAMIDKIFDGKISSFLTDYLAEQQFTQEDLDALKQLFILKTKR